MSIEKIKNISAEHSLVTLHYDKNAADPADPWTIVPNGNTPSSSRILDRCCVCPKKSTANAFSSVGTVVNKTKSMQNFFFLVPHCSNETCQLVSAQHLRRIAKEMDKNSDVKVSQCVKCENFFAKVLRCSQCRLMMYCGPVCQRADWKVHKKTCLLI